MKQRQAEFPDSHGRVGSIRKQETGGEPGMSQIGDYTAPDAPRHEYMLRVFGKATKAHFFIMMPGTADLEGAVRATESAAATLRIE